MSKLDTHVQSELSMIRRRAKSFIAARGVEDGDVDDLVALASTELTTAHPTYDHKGTKTLMGYALKSIERKWANHLSHEQAVATAETDDFTYNEDDDTWESTVATLEDETSMGQRSIDYLHAYVEHGSDEAAAEALGMTTPHLSASEGRSHQGSSEGSGAVGHRMVTLT